LSIALDYNLRILWHRGLSSTLYPPHTQRTLASQLQAHTALLSNIRKRWTGLRPCQPYPYRTRRILELRSLQIRQDRKDGRASLVWNHGHSDLRYSWRTLHRLQNAGQAYMQDILSLEDTSPMSTVPKLCRCLYLSQTQEGSLSSLHHLTSWRSVLVSMQCIRWTDRCLHQFFLVHNYHKL
jgi:hypothetical protein